MIHILGRHLPSTESINHVHHGREKLSSVYARTHNFFARFYFAHKQKAVAARPSLRTRKKSGLSTIILTDTMTERDSAGHGLQLTPNDLNTLTVLGVELGMAEKQLISTHPKCTRLHLETSYNSISSEYLSLIARRIAPWIETLRIRAGMITREKLAIFFSALASAKPVSLASIHISLTGSLSESVGQLFARLMSQSPSLETISVTRQEALFNDCERTNDNLVLNSIAASTSKGLSIKKLELFFVHGPLGSLLSTCNSLESLDLGMIDFTSMEVRSFAIGITQSRSLKSIVLSSCSMLESEVNQLVTAVAESTVESLTLGLSQVETLSSVSLLTNLKSLTLRMPPGTEESSNEFGPTNALLELLEVSSNLVELVVSRLRLPPDRFCKMLKRNSSLKCIKFTSCIEASEMTRGIIEALQHTNTTLRFVGVRGDVRSSIPASLRFQLSYLLRLNVAGRAQLRNSVTGTISNIVRALVRSSEQEWKEDEVAVTFPPGLSPSPQDAPKTSPWHPSTPAESPSNVPLSPPWRPPTPASLMEIPDAVTPTNVTQESLSTPRRMRHRPSPLSPDHLALIYGLIRDCPHLWSTEYHGRSDEDSISRNLGDLCFADEECV